MNTFIHSNRRLSVFLAGDNIVFLKSLAHSLSLQEERQDKIKRVQQNKLYQWILWILFSIVAISTIIAITVMPV
jgi:predicted tellurium resistance membrane protein TerC